MSAFEYNTSRAVAKVFCSTSAPPLLILHTRTHILSSPLRMLRIWRRAHLFEVERSRRQAHSAGYQAAVAGLLRHSRAPLRSARTPPVPSSESYPPLHPPLDPHGSPSCTFSTALSLSYLKKMVRIMSCGGIKEGTDSRHPPTATRHPPPGGAADAKGSVPVSGPKFHYMKAIRFHGFRVELLDEVTLWPPPSSLLPPSSFLLLPAGVLG